nr:MAG TPA: hypothetical protein [Caudoviricetes sp.]
MVTSLYRKSPYIIRYATDQGVGSSNLLTHVLRPLFYKGLQKKDIPYGGVFFAFD